MKNGGKLNYREISSIIGVSPATLSIIANNKTGISDKTRQKVIEKLKEHGLEYILKHENQNSKYIAFTVFKRENSILDQHPFFMFLLQDLENAVKKHGYNLIMQHFDIRDDIEPQLQTLKDLEISGMIVFATEMESADLRYFESLPYPIIFLDNYFAMDDVNSVSINNEMGTYQAIEHAASLGHKHIGYLRANERISSFREREQGFISASKKFNIENFEIINCGHSEEATYQDILNYISKKDKKDLPTLLVSDDDVLILGALRAIVGSSLRVPEDIALIGFDDRTACKITNPPVSSIFVDRYGLTLEAVASLIKLIKQEDDCSYKCKKRISTKLSIRTSSQIDK